MTRPHLQRHPGLTQARISGTRPRPPLSLTSQSSLHQSAAVHKICNNQCQHSHLIHSPHHLSCGRLSLPPHEVTPLTAATQATTRAEVLEAEGREGTAMPHMGHA